MQDLATGKHKYDFLYIQIELHKSLTSSLVIHNQGQTQNDNRYLIQIGYNVS